MGSIWAKYIAPMYSYIYMAYTVHNTNCAYQLCLHTLYIESGVMCTWILVSKVHSGGK